MKYLQSWLVDRIADTVDIIAVHKPPAKALRRTSSLAGSYIAMRTQYGRQHHWPLDKSGWDIDAYDHDSNSYYFLARERAMFRGKKLIAGLRLTRVRDFDESLSLGMWTHAVDRQKFVSDLVRHKQDVALLKKAAKKGNVWDLTRLVTAMVLQQKRSNKTKRVTYVALLLALGAAMKFTGPEALWIFTTNRELVRFLDRLGIQYTLLAQGKISYSDTGESFFGWTSAQAAYEQLKSGKSVVAHVAERGYNKGGMPQSGADSVS